MENEKHSLKVKWLNKIVSDPSFMLLYEENIFFYLIFITETAFIFSSYWREKR